MPQQPPAPLDDSSNFIRSTPRSSRKQIEQKSSPPPPPRLDFPPFCLLREKRKSKRHLLSNKLRFTTAACALSRLVDEREINILTNIGETEQFTKISRHVEQLASTTRDCSSVGLTRYLVSGACSCPSPLLERNGPSNCPFYLLQ